MRPGLAASCVLQGEDERDGRSDEGEGAALGGVGSLIFSKLAPPMVMVLRVRVRLVSAVSAGSSGVMSGTRPDARSKTDYTRCGGGDMEGYGAMANHAPQRHGSQKSAAKGRLRVEIFYYYPDGRVFSCFICGRQKKEKHLADLADNPGKVVCKPCYEERGYIQIKTAPKRPLKAGAKSPRTEVNREGEPRSARPLKSSKAAKKQKAKARPHPLSDEEARKRQTQVPALGHLISFFESAGARVQLLSDGGLEINDSVVRRLPKGLASYGQGLLDSLIDDIAVKHMRSTFIEAISENAGFGDGYRAVTKRGGKGFAVACGTTRLGYILPTRARANDGEAIEGNFLIPGPHWQRLAEAIYSEAERTREQQARAAPRTQTQALRGQRAVRRSVLPDRLDPGLARTCMDASRRIRTERQVAYEPSRHLGE